jgi:hypothetical protein
MRILAVLAAAAVALPLAPGFAYATAPAAASVIAPVAAYATAPAARAEPGSLTCTVQPATADGPDGRRWIEKTLDPGQVVTEYLAVRNFSDAGAVFALKAADGYLTDKGRFNMLPSDRKSVDGGAWISVQPTVTVPAEGTKVVPFRITVPKEASPGDHPAGIAASVLSGAGTVRVESRVGFRVLLRASGEVHPALTPSAVKVDYRRSWNPFKSGTATVSYEASNSRNVRATIAGKATISGFLGLNGHERTISGGELLPHGKQPAQIKVGGIWALGRLTTDVTLIPAGGTATTASTTIWALPLPQLLLALAVVLLLLALRARRRHNKRKLARLIDEARRDGAHH